MSAANLMVIQGGGPTPVFNASLASIVEEGLRQPGIGKIFGARSGMKGLTSGDIVELSRWSAADLDAVATSPGAALGSSRFKPTEEDLERCVGHLRRLEIRHLFFMGGNGTMSGAQRFSDFCSRLGFDVQTIGVPKTIDNDIAATDRCPGFGSAARFVAQSTLDLAMDIRSLPQPVSIFETLGRDVGWLAASATLARRRADDAPQLVYVPEVAFSIPAFLAELDAVVSRVGWAVVVVSEGIAHADGTPVFEQKIASREGAAPNRPLIGGVAQYLSGVVAEHLGLRCRSEKPGLIGRSCMAHVSAQDRIDAKLVGREGVRALLSGATDQMVSLQPLTCSDETFQLSPLREAAGATRRLPAQWLTKDSSTVTSDFAEYVRPIIGELAFYRDVV
jgi:6-phosphofructokinase